MRHFIPLNLVFAAAAATFYMQNPLAKPFVLRNVTGAADAAIGTGETVTITENSAPTSLGVLTFAGTVAPAAVGAWVTDATNGDHVIGAAEVLKFVCTAGAAGNVKLTLELDDHCLEA